MPNATSQAASPESEARAEPDGRHPHPLSGVERSGVEPVRIQRGPLVGTQRHITGRSMFVTERAGIEDARAVVAMPAHQAAVQGEVPLAAGSGVEEPVRAVEASYPSQTIRPGDGVR